MKLGLFALSQSKACDKRSPNGHRVFKGPDHECSEPFELTLPPLCGLQNTELFILLCVHILKVDHIREKSDFLLENMAFFFIPAGVSIINYFDVLKNWVVQLIVICVVSTVVTFAVTAYSMKLALYLMQKKKSGRAKE